MQNKKEFAIVVEQKLCMAHRLMGHPGKCKHLHGHNYRVRIRICRAADDMDKSAVGDGMVMDFGTVKQDVLKCLDEVFDHKTVLQRGDPLIPAIFESELTDSKHDDTSLVILHCRPTAENLAAYIYEFVQRLLRKRMEVGVRLDSVSVEETPGNWACYME